MFSAPPVEGMKTLWFGIAASDAAHVVAAGFFIMHPAFQRDRHRPCCEGSERFRVRPGMTSFDKFRMTTGHLINIMTSTATHHKKEIRAIVTCPKMNYEKDGQYGVAVCSPADRLH